MDQALAGVRVVDFSQFIAGPLAAMQFAGLGADVIRVDAPGGPRWEHPSNAVLQRGKRSIVLDLAAETDRGVALRLIDTADVVFESWRPGVADRLGVGPDVALARNPRLVYCSVPGFGRTDPRRGLPGWEGVIAAVAGLFPARESGEPGEPRFTALPMASSFAAMQACHGVLAALLLRERTGVGQHVEVALFDAAFELLGGGAQKIGDVPPPPQGGAAPATMPQIGHYRCADGRWVQLCLVQPRHLDWFVRTFLPERVGDGWSDADRVRADAGVQAAMRERLGELMATRPAREWERLINEKSGAPTGVCQTTEDWLRHDQHARDSGAVIEVPSDPELGDTIQAGHPIGMSLTPPRADGPRHPLDADRAAILAELDSLAARPPAPGSGTPAAGAGAPPRPLDGVKVIDVSQVLAGPTLARILADYGAEVIKINSPQDRQHFQHLYTNAGKKTILLDLKKPEGMAVFWRLAEDADILVENFTLGVAERLGIGEADVRARRPDIVYASVSAFGHEGYRGGYRGREELGQAVTGLQMRWFGAGSPRMVFYPLNDYGAGNWGAFATLAALYYRIRGGCGQRVHASLAHAATFHQVPFMVWFDGQSRDEPSGEEAPGWTALDRIYRGADRWFYLAAQLDNRAAVRDVTGLDLDFADDRAAAESLARAFRARPAAEWVAALTGRGVAASLVLSQEEAMDDELTRSRGLSVVRSLPGGEPIRTVGLAGRLALTPLAAGPLPGPVGSDYAAVLEAAGLSDTVSELVAKEAVLPELPADAGLVGRFRPAG